MDTTGAKKGFKLRMYHLWIVLSILAGMTLRGQSPELIIPANHGQRIFGMEVSPNGELLATCAGSEVRIWDYSSGKLLKFLDLTGPEFWTNDLRSVAFSKDGTYLAAISGNRFNLIDVASLQVIHTQDLTRGLEKKEYDVGVVVAHPAEGVYYFEAWYGQEHVLQRFDPANQTITTRATFAYPGKESRAAKRITFSPDGKQALVTFFTSDDAVVVNLVSGKVSSYPGGQYWLPNGNLLLQRRLGAGLSLAVYQPDGKAVWTKDVAGADLKVGDFEYYGRQWGNLAIDPASKRFYYGLKKGGMIAGNYVTGADVALVDKPGAMDNPALTVAPNGHLLVSSGYPSKIAESDGKTRQTLRHFGVPLLAVSELTTDPGSLSFAVSSHAGENKLVALTPRGLRVKATGETPEGTVTAISPGGNYAATITKAHGVTWLNGNRPEWIRLQPAYPEPRAIALDKEGNLAVQSAGGISYYPARVPESRWTAPGENHPKAFAKSYRVALSPDGSMLVALDFLEESEIDEESMVTAYSTKNGKVKWQRRIEFNDFVFSPDGQELIGSGFYQEIVRLNASNGKELSRIARNNGNHFEASFNLAGSLLAGTGKKTAGRSDETIEIVDTRSTLIIQELAGHIGTINNTGFLPNDFLISAGFDNTVRLWDLKTGKEVAKLFLFDGSNDWVVLSTNGQFDATPSAMQHLYYVLGKQIVPLEQLYEGFYTPGLLGQLLDRKSTPAPPPVSIGSVAPPPTVTLAYEAGTRNLIVAEDEPEQQEIVARTQEAKIVIRASAPQDQVQEIRLYHNGKLLGGKGRNLIVEDDASGTEKTFNLLLLPGDNTFRAVAVNSQRTESAPALLLVRYLAPAAPPDPVPAEGITLHLMTIGINVYQNPRYNLNYAAADASGIDAALKAGLSGIVGDIKTHSFRDAGATRSAILTAISTIAAEADADDIFVFYFAGHGVMNEAQKQEFYLIPHDLTQLYGNDQGLAAKGISATELRDLAAAIPAQKQLYILDACQSAGAVQSIAQRGVAEEKAIAQLARSTGTHWLTASGSEQFANEFDQLGHGAFTYVLLEALAGKAAGSDTRVSVNELKAYLDNFVPEITQRYNGQAQYPASYGYGQDFPISVKR